MDKNLLEICYLTIIYKIFIFCIFILIIRIQLYFHVHIELLFMLFDIDSKFLYLVCIISLYFNFLWIPFSSSFFLLINKITFHIHKFLFNLCQNCLRPFIVLILFLQKILYIFVEIYEETIEICISKFI